MPAGGNRDFRLPKDPHPTRYGLQLRLDLRDWVFQGRALISLNLRQPSHELVLHSAGLDITLARLDSGPLVQSISYDDGAQTAALGLDDELPAGAVVLEVHWTGQIGHEQRGLYRSLRGDERYAATQLETCDARRVFPCFDEPEFKARFALELVHDADLVALSNGSVEHRASAGARWSVTRFAETPPISTYLVAFTVGPYEGGVPVRSRSGVPVRVWLPPGLASQSAYASDVHVRSLEWLERYVGMGYPYGKLDAIGIPDFGAGAMENPGAITYRPQLLAVEPATIQATALKHVHSVISHEVTHMWWGDLVTMAWWNDLWLKEAFASLVGQKCTAALNPDWRYVRDIAADAIPAFNLDQLTSTHAVAMEVRNADEASQRLDDITYKKGQAILRMFEGFLGDSAFRDGARAFVQRHKENNATSQDFWRELGAASGLDVLSMANPWLNEPGHPLVTCRAREVARSLEVDLHQQRFLLDGASDAPPSRPWPIPLVFRYGAGDRVYEARVLMRGERASVSLPGAQWYHPNAAARGFYRYALDDKSFDRLARHLPRLAEEERAMHMDNQWALTRAGKAPLRQFFVLLSASHGEEDRAVLDALLNALQWLSDHAIADAHRPAFEKFVTHLFVPLLARLGWDPSEDERHEDAEVRARVILALGDLGGSDEVRAEARRRVAGYLNGNLSLEPTTASAAVRIAAIGGDAELWGQYAVRMRSAGAVDIQDEERFREGLTAFADPVLVERTAQLCFSEFVRPHDKANMIVALVRSRRGRAVAWPIVCHRWDSDVVPLVQRLRARVIKSLAELTPPGLASAAAEWLRVSRMADTTEVTAQALETLELNVSIAERLRCEAVEFFASAEPPEA